MDEILNSVTGKSAPALPDKLSESSTDDMRSEFTRLLHCKSLGFYNCCEITTFFLCDKDSKEAYHFFSICVFEERFHWKDTVENMMPKLAVVTDKVSLGGRRRVVGLDSGEAVYDALCAALSGGNVDIGDGELKIGRLEWVPKVFVPKNSTKEPIINKILKNNFQNGSYILKFFDVEKPCKELLGKKGLKKAANVIYQRLPVDLFTVSDRIGNFVFQFPSVNIQVSYATNREETQLEYHVEPDGRLREKCRLELKSQLSYDGNTVGFGTAVCSLSEKSVIDVGDSSHLCHTIVWDPENQLILNEQETAFMRHIHGAMHFRSGDIRQIWDEDHHLTAEIELSHLKDMSVHAPVIRAREDDIEERQYVRRTEEHEKRQEFRRYGIPGHGTREEALRDVRSLMDRGAGGTVYLWDPYLNAEDLLDTWYYTTTYSARLKAITSRESAAVSSDSLEEWFRHQREILEKRSDNNGISMEMRCQWGNYGYHFHDRFLMVLLPNKKPVVWSLGMSINNIGKSHHIIQLVSYPQMVVDAFEELWDMLDHEECLVWKRGVSHGAK